MGKRRSIRNLLRLCSGLVALGGLIAAGMVTAVRHDAGTDAVTTPLLMAAILVLLGLLATGSLVLSYTVLKSTTMTRNLVKIITAVRTRWD